MTIQTVVLNIEGMSCQGCVKSVHDAVLQVVGVQDCIVNLNNNHAIIKYDDTVSDVQTLQKVVEDAGFDVKNVQ